MAKIVSIYAHPNHKASLANQLIMEEFKKLLPSLDAADLGALYPNYKMDIKREQDRLKNAEMIIFQYPFWWYGAPSLLHAYIEQVFAHGWAYGHGGEALKGKSLTLSFTTGAPEADYSPQTLLHHNITDYLTGMMSTAAFTGMAYRGAVYSFEMIPFDAAGKSSQEMKDKVAAKAKDHAERLYKHIAQFVSV